MSITHTAYSPAQGWGPFGLHAELIERFESYCSIGDRPGEWEFVAPTYKCTTFTLITGSSASCSVYWWEERGGHVSELVVGLSTHDEPHCAAFAVWFEALREEFGLIEETTSR